MKKVIAGILALCLLAVLLGSSSALLLRWTALGKDEVLFDEVQDLLRAQALYATSQRAAYQLRSYLLVGRSEMRGQYERTWAHFQETLVGMEQRTAHPEAVSLLRDIRLASTQLETVVVPLMREREQGTALEQLALAVEEELQPRRALVDDVLTRLVILKQRQLERAQEETARAASGAVRLTWGMSLGVLVFATGLVWLFIRYERTARRASEFERQLVAIVSHDLRSPLSAILMVTQALARKGDESPPARAVERIERSARRIQSITNLLLDFTQARLGTGIPVVVGPVDLRTLCHEVVEEARACAPERNLHENYLGDLHGQWDFARLAQVLSNLVQNALKYSPPDTPVEVRATAQEDSVRVEVHNQGAPIPKHLLPTLFMPFQSGAQTAETVKVSLGLGLYIVHEIVRAHDGNITVRSDAESGTHFTLTLPRAPPARRMRMARPTAQLGK